MARIIVIEDDSEIRRLVARGLASGGHHVETAATALEGLRITVGEDPEVVILDLGLPDLDGSELIRMIRAVSQVPIIVATARDDNESAIALLDAGADDYIVKPYAVENLEARIRAVLRRTASKTDTAIHVVGPLKVDPTAREVTLDDQPIELTPKEFDLLLFLTEHLGEVITKRQLLAEVWREPYGGSERTVDVHLSWLRKKLGETASEPRFLRTVHGVGVKLVAP